MTFTVPDQQILQGVAATLRWTHTDGDGVPVAASGTVNVVVTRADGTVLVTSTAATPDPNASAGDYTLPLTAAQAATLDVLTATWTDSNSSARTTVEIVGGLLFTVPEMQAQDSLASTPAATLIAARLVVAAELEWICDRAFSPRYRYVTLDGPGDLSIVPPSNERGSSHDLRTLVAATVDGGMYTSPQIAAIIVQPDRFDQPFGGLASVSTGWNLGQRNVTIGYTYGLDRCPPDLKAAALTRLRIVVNRPKSGIPDRARTLTLDQVGTMTLDMAGQYKTGYPEIDAVYSRWSNRTDGDGEAAAFGFVDSNPQYFSLFHGGRR